MLDDLAGTPLAGTLVAGIVRSWENQPFLSGSGNLAAPESWARSTVTRH